MKKYRLAMLPAITALCAVTACEPPSRPVTEGNIKGSFFEDLFGERCSLEILFGSYASGIDDKSYREIKALLASRSGKFTMSEKQWGREGEKAVCANGTDKKAVDALEKDIAQIIAANEPTEGPVTVTRGPLLK
ncbi:hypothetical protein ACFOWX_03230 [Sphingorhabdus arenilitoris]|uniref:Lipoprotein n=1 Tax=Sphingorhabdus arenilitoris TaxID=1490041 RepID=A0ABV8RDD4_9SPHN